MASRFRTCGWYVVALVSALAGVGVALVSVSVAGAASNAAVGITGGQTLTSGSTLQSPDGRYQAVFSNGKLSVSIAGGGRTLTTEGSSSPGAYTVLQPNGDLVIFTASGQVLWDSGSTGSGCPALGMQNDGDLVDYDTQNIWESNTAVHDIHEGETLAPGQSIYSKGLEFQLEMQTNGNLTLENAGGTKLWQSNTSGNSGASATLSDGNFEVLSTAGKTLWSSGTAGDSDADLEVESGGNVELVSSSGTVKWQTNTANATADGSFAVQVLAPSSTPCPGSVAPPTTTATVVQTQTVTSTATVTVPTTTVVTVAAPPSPEKHLAVTMKLDFTYAGPITTLHSVAIGKLPIGAELTATYDPHITGRRDRVLHAVPGREMIVLITYLRLLRYRPGQTLNLDLTRRGYRNEWATFTFRDANLPAARGNIISTKR